MQHDRSTRPTQQLGRIDVLDPPRLERTPLDPGGRHLDGHADHDLAEHRPHLLREGHQLGDEGVPGTPSGRIDRVTGEPSQGPGRSGEHRGGGDRVEAAGRDQVVVTGVEPLPVAG